MLRYKIKIEDEDGNPIRTPRSIIAQLLATLAINIYSFSLWILDMNIVEVKNGK